MAAFAADAAAEGIALLAGHRPAEALAALTRALDDGDLRPTTLLNHALAACQAGAPEAGEHLLVTASRFPEWDEAALRIAEHHRAAGDAEAAVVAYRRVLTLAPDRIEALLALGALLVGQGEAKQALALLRRCCEIAPSLAEAWDALGLALLLDQAPIEALAALTTAQRLDPGRIDFGLHRAHAAHAAGAREAVLAAFEAEAAVDPLNLGLLGGRALLLEWLGRRDEAIDLMQAAAELAPDCAWLQANAAVLLARGLRQHEAARALAHARSLDPTDPDLALTHAVVLLRLHRHAEAHALMQEMTELHGENASFETNKATASLAIGLQARAEAEARRAIALAPDQPLGWRSLINTLPYCETVNAAELLQAAQRCAALLPATPHVIAPARDPERRLRLGLLSGSLRQHPVGWLTVAAFEALDPSEFEIVCLAATKPTDSIGRRFERRAAHWVETAGLDDGALAGRIVALGIDVLIDLGGYGDLGRMPVCAGRVAPVQIKWVGMQNHSTGLPAMDWFVTDRWETPLDCEAFYSERPLRLPDGYVCYSPPADAPDLTPLPALTRGHVTFGCFNNLAKVTPRVIAVWAEILRALPDARMILKTQQYGDGEVRARLHDAFASHGIAAGRIDLRGASPHRAFLGEYRDVDIVLDPFPYAGGLTTCEALWMGVPTITLPGQTFASRHSTSHLCNVGLPDWVAADEAAYIAQAIDRSGDLVALAALRQGLRAQMRASPLCDAPRFGAGLAAALRRTWRDACTRNGA